MSQLGNLIREGAQRHSQQAHGDFYDNGAVCALGGAILAWREDRGDPIMLPNMIKATEWEHILLPDMISDLDIPDWEYAHICPADDCSEVHLHVTGCVMHLNDDHYWTPEEIANWLDLHFPETA